MTRLAAGTITGQEKLSAPAAWRTGSRLNRLIARK